MSVIATRIEPHGVTRVFFDYRDVVPDTADRRRIEQAVERSFALAEADDDAPAGGVSSDLTTSAAMRGLQNGPNAERRAGEPTASSPSPLARSHQARPTQNMQLLACCKSCRRILT